VRLAGISVREADVAFLAERLLEGGYEDTAAKNRLLGSA